MPLTADIFYSRLLEATSLSPVALEKQVGLGNGVVAKAINKKSTLRSGTIIMLAKAFPNLNPNFIESGALPVFQDRDDSRDKGSTTSEPPPIYARRQTEVWKDKYLASLEQQVKFQDLLQQTAAAAIEAATATTRLIHNLPSEFVTWSAFEPFQTRLNKLEQFTARKLADLSGRKVTEMEAELRL